MKKISVVVSVVVLLFSLIVIGYTQYSRQQSISAVLQNQLDFNAPPDYIFTITTFEQNLSDSKKLPKGTRFIGMLSKVENNFEIYFDTIQTPGGKQEQFLGKSVFDFKERGNQGVSAKISRTLYQQTKTNVLGAIFNNPNAQLQPQSLVLPRGTLLKIEIN